MTRVLLVLLLILVGWVANLILKAARIQYGLRYVSSLLVPLATSTPVPQSPCLTGRDDRRLLPQSRGGPLVPRATVPPAQRDAPHLGLHKSWRHRRQLA